MITGNPISEKVTKELVTGKKENGSSIIYLSDALDRMMALDETLTKEDKESIAKTFAKTSAKLNAFESNMEKAIIQQKENEVQLKIKELQTKYGRRYEDGNYTATKTKNICEFGDYIVQEVSKDNKEDKAKYLIWDKESRSLMRDDSGESILTFEDKDEAFDYASDLNEGMELLKGM